MFSFLLYLLYPILYEGNKTVLVVQDLERKGKETINQNQENSPSCA